MSCAFFLLHFGAGLDMSAVAEIGGWSGAGTANEVCFHPTSNAGATQAKHWRKFLESA